ncbi:MAG TPA: YdcF family protein [Oculatellaceae cyanobacterium]|jgi:uncharacterized SAM-binding protein YcdF (DUF218 family)
MVRKQQNKLTARRHKYQHGYRFRHKQLLLSSISLILGIWLLINTLILGLAASRPVDAFFVLGGSIQREIYVAQLAQKYPEIPILISQGSKESCVLRLFQREQALIEQVWLERCAKSTFDNFYFGIPILHQWGVHKVKLITSPTHLPRAQWLAQILLGAHGIWVDLDIVQEQGIPGNRESWSKTALDLIRALVWAVISQVYSPKCDRVINLSDVNISGWQTKGFKCEHQANI